MSRPKPANLVVRNGPDAGLINHLYYLNAQLEYMGNRHRYIGTVLPDLSMHYYKYHIKPLINARAVAYFYKNENTYSRFNEPEEEEEVYCDVCGIHYGIDEICKQH